MCIFHNKMTPSNYQLVKRLCGTSCPVITLRGENEAGVVKTDKTEDVYHSVMGSRAAFSHI